MCFSVDIFDFRTLTFAFVAKTISISVVASDVCPHFLLNILFSSWYTDVSLLEFLLISISASVSGYNLSFLWPISFVQIFFTAMRMSLSFF